MYFGFDDSGLFWNVLEFFYMVECFCYFKELTVVCAKRLSLFIDWTALGAGIWYSLIVVGKNDGRFMFDETLTGEAGLRKSILVLTGFNTIWDG